VDRRDVGPALAGCRRAGSHVGGGGAGFGEDVPLGVNVTKIDEVER